MRLGYKSQILLDAIFTAGIDMLSFSVFPSRSLLRIGGWEQEKYLKRHLKVMVDEGWIVWDDSKESGKWAFMITKAGKAKLLSDFDPVPRWSKEWDGNWKIIGFDLPARHSKIRRDLINWLRSQRFGKLQDSLWITPCFEESWHEELTAMNYDPSAVSFISGQSFSKSKDIDFVKKAWNFDRINQAYRQLIEKLSESERTGPNVTSDWIRDENALWRNAFELDPFLPEAISPPSYLGQQAYALRRKRYADLLS